jgi:hypothetical protein
MNARVFRRGVERALLSAGFERHGKVLRWQDSRVWTIVGVEPGFGRRWHVNVGFSLRSLEAEPPRNVEGSHLYFRLERLFADHSATITLAGALDDERQPEAYAKLQELLVGAVAQELRALGTEEGLRDAMIAGGLVHGLVTKEARAFLLAR